MSAIAIAFLVGIVVGATPVFNAWDHDRRRWARKLARAVGHPAGRGGSL